MTRVFRRSAPRNARLYFPGNEIERICLQMLESVDLLPREPEPIRIERFLEKRFGVVPDYRDLGHTVLGVTQFSDGEVQGVFVNRFLDGEDGSVRERRLRTTLAHEAGHCILHANLFKSDTATQPMCIDWTEPERPRAACREVGASAAGRYKGDWFEYQANRAIGGLLLPKPLVELAVEPFMKTTGWGLKMFDHAKAEGAELRIAEVFNVNPIVARIRITDIFGPDSGQLAL